MTQSLNLTESIANLLQTQQLNHFNVPLKPLLPLEGNTGLNEQHGILFHINEYLELVD